MVNKRPRGILTQSDRELLEMGGERREKYSRPNLIQRKGKIEERARNGVQDLGLLYRYLPSESRENVFQPLSEAMWPWSPRNLLSDGFGWMLLGFLEQENRELDDEEYYERVFTRSIENILGSGMVDNGEVDVDVSIEGWAPHDEIHEHEDLADLQPALLRSLLTAGEITDEEFAEAIIERRENSDE